MSSPLPLEIFPIVFEHAEEEELFKVASTCRTFNRLAFQVYFLRCGKDPRLKTETIIDLHSTSLPPSYLQALVSCLEMRGKKLDRLIYRYDAREHWKYTLWQVKLLTRLMNSLGDVDRLEMRLLLPSSRTRGLGKANAELLKTVNKKHSTYLDVSGRFTLYYCPLFSKSLRKHHPDFGDSLPILWAKKCLHIQSSDGGNHPSNLSQMVLRNFPLSFRQYYLDTLRASRLTLTTLDFVDIPSYATKDFSIILSDVTFPNLQKFYLTSCKNIHQAAIVSFLARHPNLQFLRYLLVDYSPGSNVEAPIPLLLSSKFQKVERLETSPRYIHGFLPPLSSFPALNKITIYTSVGSLLQLASTLDQALASLRSCRNPIDLTILSPCYESGLEQWYTRGMDIDDEHRPERTLHCVRSLTVEHQRAGFSGEMLNKLPHWVALFPKLNSIQLKAYTKKPRYATPLPPQRISRLVHEVMALCPQIEKFTIGCGNGEPLEYSGLV